MSMVEAKRLIEWMADNLIHCTLESGVCHCGDDMTRHADPMSCGHTPVDMGWTAAENWSEAAQKWLAEQP